MQFNALRNRLKANPSALNIALQNLLRQGALEKIPSNKHKQGMFYSIKDVVRDRIQVYETVLSHMKNSAANKSVLLACVACAVYGTAMTSVSSKLDAKGLAQFSYTPLLSLLSNVVPKVTKKLSWDELIDFLRTSIMVLECFSNNEYVVESKMLERLRLTLETLENLKRKFEAKMAEEKQIPPERQSKVSNSFDNVEES